MTRATFFYLSLLVLLSTQYVFGTENFKSSLTFVIDDTYSMSDDIDEVKLNVNAIFDTVLRNNASQIENFILVTFNDDGHGDPGVLVRSNTKDREEFRNALSAIDVHGGGDCPEYAMTGIKKALEESLDRSYIYVFTDATAKDYEDYEEIKAFAQLKQIQIVFVLSISSCITSIDIDTPDHQVYYSLATATSGQVFNLRKGDVGKVLGYVNRTVTGRRTTLVNEKLPPGKNNMTFNVDAIMGEIMLSLASTKSDDPSVTIKGPDGSDVYKKIIFETDQIQVYSLDATMPGAHTVEVNCKAETQAVISARSGVDFQHGFSAYKLSSLVDTSATPAPGKSHLSIKLNEGDIVLQTVQILDMNDNVKMELPLEVINRGAKFYTTPAFDPPNIMFKIAIIGYDPKTSSNVTRKAPTPVEVYKPPPGKTIENKSPSISMRNVINAKYGEPLQVICRVNGYPQPSVVWKNKDKGTFLSGEVSPLILPYVYTSILSIEKVQENMTYECDASNSLGSDSKQVIITTIVLDKFNVLDTPQRVTVEYQKEGQISCVVDAYPPAHIFWFKGGARLKPSENIEISINKTIVTIKHATPTDGGRYTCVAKNAFKKKKIYKYITVTGTAWFRPENLPCSGDAGAFTKLNNKYSIREIPEVDKSTSDASVTKGSSVVLECKILKGIPKPSITWYHSMNEVTEWQGKERVYVSVRNKFDAGNYLCEAKNDVGADYHEISLKLQYPPSITDSAYKTVAIAAGSKLSIPCHADGGPKPHVTWYKDGVEITNSDKVDIFGDQTLRFIVQPSDTGLYACKATNAMGSVSKTVKVDVNVPVNIRIPKESKVTALIGDQLTLLCEATGNPEPSINWIYHTFSSAPPQTISSTLKVLQLNHLQVSDEGYYTCIASNVGGAMNITYEVHVLAPPSIKESDNRFEVVAGDYALRIPCEATGNPKPVIIWKKDGLNLAIGSLYYMSDGTLIISNIPRDASGTYTCVAENSVGTATGTYEVTVVDNLTPSSPTSSVVLEQGKPTEINCTIPHKTVVNNQHWYKDGTFIKSGKLELVNPEASDSGDYTCRVSDFLETVSVTTRIVFGTKPELTFSEGDEDIELTVGSEVILNCENRGEPTPEVEWYHDDKKLEETGAEYKFPMDKMIPGQYKCIVKNTLGSITKNFNVVPRDCFINTTKLTKLQPLMLTPSLKWPIVDKIEEFMVLSKGEQFILVCPTEFLMFPKQDVIAFCDGGMNKILINGHNYDYSEIQCTEEVKHVVQEKGSECIEGSKDTESISIGYNINRKIREIAAVYEVCWNKTSKTPIYAKNTMPVTPSGAEYDTTWLDIDKFKMNFDEAYDCDLQINAISAQLGQWFHSDDKCCFSKRQLVSPKDVFSGAPQTSTFSYYNVVPHWSTCSTENWDEVEERVRNLAYKLNDEFLVWTGTANELSLKGKRGMTNRLLMDTKGYEQSVSTFLWKVIQDPVTMTSLAIIQVNVPDLSSDDVSKYVLCEDQCDRVEWMRNPEWHDVRKGYIYCCKIDEFETAFGLTNIFEPEMMSLLNNDYEYVPEFSLTL